MDPTEITPYKRMIMRSLEYYHRRYDSDPEFRQNEIERNSRRVKNCYANDPAYRQRMIDNAKARYYRIKAVKEATAQAATN